MSSFEGAFGISSEQQAKLAYVYVRQSSLAQVNQHSESTDLQYKLVERAVGLGWPHERIHIIDDDLGKSASRSEDRIGFQRLIAEIGFARVGLVVSLDASRMARNNHDWYQLLDLCAVFGTLIADGERLYHPGLYQDRMLLGLSGMMSEAELHQLKLRLQAGARNKAERGDLLLPLPAGLSRSIGSEVILNPDDEVRSRLQLTFAKFNELGSARAVVRYLRHHSLLLPIRPLQGPSPHPIVWREASSSRVREILRNPAYAGTYVYGRRMTDPVKRKAHQPRSGSVERPLEAWSVVLHDHYPAYISWQQFLDHQAQLKRNRSHYKSGGQGVAREGAALLQGLVRCGQCGAKMQMRYSGSPGNYAAYRCAYANSHFAESPCQEVRSHRLDAEVERCVLEALAPDRLALAVSALEALEKEQKTLAKQWQMRLERARYETERAQRQYDAVEPENRLVARNLEKHWEAKLRTCEALEREHQTWLKQQQRQINEEERASILALGVDLPALWRAATTTAIERKEIMRLIVKEIIVSQRQQQGKVCFKIVWQTGACTEHSYHRAVHCYNQHADWEILEKRLAQLHAQGLMDREIAVVLNDEGLKTARGKEFTSDLVWLLRKRLGLTAIQMQSKMEAV